MSPHVSYFEIVDAICAARGCVRSELQSPRRGNGLPEARSEVWHLARCLTTLSLPEIGRLANRDHTAILAGTVRCQMRMDSNPVYAREINAMQARLRAAATTRAIETSDACTARQLAARIASGSLPLGQLTRRQILSMADALVAVPVTETTNIGGHHG